MDEGVEELSNSEPQPNQPVSESKPQARIDRTVFTDDEVMSTVKGFISAYIKGTITITFLSMEDMKTLARLEGKTLTDKEAWDGEVEHKKDFVKKIEICSGRRGATEEELRKAVNGIFADLLAYRTSQRIKGTFLDAGIEERLANLEKKLIATNNVVTQLVTWLTEEARGS